MISVGGYYINPDEILYFCPYSNSPKEYTSIFLKGGIHPINVRIPHRVLHILLEPDKFPWETLKTAREFDAKVSVSGDLVKKYKHPNVFLSDDSIIIVKEGEAPDILPARHHVVHFDNLPTNFTYRKNKSMVKIYTQQIFGLRKLVATAFLSEDENFIEEVHCCDLTYESHIEKHFSDTRTRVYLTDD